MNANMFEFLLLISEVPFTGKKAGIRYDEKTETVIYHENGNAVAVINGSRLSPDKVVLNGELSKRLQVVQNVLTAEGYALSPQRAASILVEAYHDYLYDTPLYEEWEESPAPAGERPLKVVNVAGMPNAKWLKWRTKGIGGSDSSIIMGVSPFSILRKLFFVKTGAQPFFDEEGNDFAKEFGHVNEELVSQLFAKKTGFEVVELEYMFCHPKHRWMQANIDRLIRFPDGTLGILECKTTGYRVAFDKWGNEDNPKVPENYYWQVQHYLEVMNLDVAYICCLWGNNESDFCIRKIERNRSDAAKLIEREEKFWNQVLSRTVPEYDGSYDLCCATMAQYEEKAGNIALSAPETGEALRKYDELHTAKLEHERAARQLDKDMNNALVAVLNEMGSAKTGTYVEPDGKTYSVQIKSSERVSIPSENVAKLKELDPVLYDELKKVTKSSSVSVKVS